MQEHIKGGLFLANLVQFLKFYFTDGTACVDPQGEEATVVFVGPQSMRTYMASFGYEVKSPDLGVLDRLHASFNNFVQTASRPFGALFRKWNIQMNINPYACTSNAHDGLSLPSAASVACTCIFEFHLAQNINNVNNSFTYFYSSQFSFLDIKFKNKMISTTQL